MGKKEGKKNQTSAESESHNLLIKIYHPYREKNFPWNLFPFP